jgi:hypothetical protein
MVVYELEMSLVLRLEYNGEWWGCEVVSFVGLSDDEFG